MQKDIVKPLCAMVERSYGLCMQFIDVCPLDIWNETFGGWPVWQQIGHTFAAYNFFLLQEGDTPLSLPFSTEAGHLSIVASSEQVSKEAMKEFAAVAHARFTAYVEGLADSDLGALHEGLTARMGQPMSHAATLSLIHGHNLYHLGSCDAALRQHGLKGVF